MQNTIMYEIQSKHHKGTISSLLEVVECHLVILQMEERSRAVGVGQRQLLRHLGSQTQALSGQKTDVPDAYRYGIEGRMLLNDAF